MPLTWALSLTVTNWMVILPLLSACGGELFDHRLVFGPGGGQDVEVGQHLVSVDDDVEDARASRRPELLGEMQAQRVGMARREAGDDVAEVAVPVALVDRLQARGW